MYPVTVPLQRPFLGKSHLKLIQYVAPTSNLPTGSDVEEIPERGINPRAPWRHAFSFIIPMLNLAFLYMGSSLMSDPLHFLDYVNLASNVLCQPNEIMPRSPGSLWAVEHYASLDGDGD